MICTKTRSAKAISYSALRIQCNYTSEKAASAYINKIDRGFTFSTTWLISLCYNKSTSTLQM